MNRATRRALRKQKGQSTIVWPTFPSPLFIGLCKRGGIDIYPHL
jgi:hypothetical protein